MFSKAVELFLEGAEAAIRLYLSCRIGPRGRRK